MDKRSPQWLDAAAACERLGVKPATLYAYVSRGRIRTRTPGDDHRRRLYQARDIETLLKANRRPRSRSAVAAQSLSWGEPVLKTQISAIIDGELYIGGRALSRWASEGTMEDVAAHLLKVEHSDLAKNQHPNYEVEGPFGIPALFSALANYSGLSLKDRTAELSDAEAISLCGYALTGEKSARPLHLRLADKWTLTADGAEILRQALVCLTEHGLNASTFAVRTAASAGATQSACLLAGLSTLSGLHHGASADQAAMLLRGSYPKPVTDAAIKSIYGHPIYPEGDPRAKILLSAPQIDKTITDYIYSQSPGAFPNVDASLVAIALTYDLPPGALLEIFCAARSVGWLAHLAEQRHDGRLIRPRAGR